jgi:hypothetical protein
MGSTSGIWSAVEPIGHSVRQDRADKARDGDVVGEDGDALDRRLVSPLSRGRCATRRVAPGGKVLSGSAPAMAAASLGSWDRSGGRYGAHRATRASPAALARVSRSCSR